MTDPQKELNKLKDHYSKTLFSLFSLLKRTRLYKPDHPSVAEGTQIVLNSFMPLFADKTEITFGQTEGIIYAEDFYFFDESVTLLQFLKKLEDKKIHELSFVHNITASEILSFISYLDNDSSSAFTSDHIRLKYEVDSSMPKSRNQESLALIEKLKTQYPLLIKGIFETQNLVLSEFHDLTDHMIDKIQDSPSDLVAAIVPRFYDADLSDHAVRSMLISLYIGNQLGLDHGNMKLLAIAAFLHDIARHLLPSQFVSGYRIQGRDDELLKSHTEQGALLLLGVHGLSPIVARAAFEHHLKYCERIGENISRHPFSEIISIADFISWGTLRTTYYHKPDVFHRVLRIVVSRSGTWFNPTLVKLVVPLFGLYPLGWRVQLSDNRVGFIYRNNVKNIVRPVLAFQTPDDHWVSEPTTKMSEKEPYPFLVDVVKLLRR